MPAEFHFLRPLWLWLLPLLALLIWRLLRGRAEGDAWRGLVDPHLLPHLLVDGGGSARRLPVLLMAIAGVLLILALAGPTWQRLPQPVYQAQQYRVIALDLSPTMNATDLVPTRLAHARFEILDLLRHLQEGQTALLAYGSEPYVVSPLTSDAATITAQVPSLESGLLPEPGARRTELALEEAGRLLEQAGAPQGEIILVTDGLDRPAVTNAAAQRLRGKGYRVSVLGLGTAKGAPVALAGGGFLKDTDGAILVPRLQPQSLQALASAGGGAYVTARADDREIEVLLPGHSAALSESAQQARLQADQWYEQGPWLLLALIPLAALGFRRGWLSPLLLVLTILPGHDAYALGWQDLWSTPDQRAMQQLEAGEAAKAAQLFEQPDWQAAAHYRAGDYDQALHALQGQQGPAADYNRGNALARSGQLEQALAAYDAALQGSPEDQDARFNRELVNKLLQQQKAEQRQQRESQGGDDQSQQEQPQQDAGGDSGNENQQQQDEQGGQGSQEQKEQADGSGQGAQQQQDAQGSEGEQDKQQQDAQGSKGGQDKRQQAAGEKDSQQAQADQENPLGEQPQEQQTAQSGAGQQSQDPDRSQAQQGEAEQQQAANPPQQPANDRHGTSEPTARDLLGGEPARRHATNPSELQQGDPENRQAMEQMLRRVPDDPAGLLRQRFLLQHLRRHGRLPGGS